MVLKIGLTGGIGSGKSVACAIFSDLGVPIIDADVIAHSLVKPDMLAFKKIIKLFGKGILSSHGTIDRKKIRKQVFANASYRKKLENILHPDIYEEITAQVKKIDSKYCIISIPLLLETDASKTVDRVLVIDLPKELQLERAINRDKMDKGDMNAIIDSQISRQHRLAAADDIIDNKGGISKLRKEINDLHKFYANI